MTPYRMLTCSAALLSISASASAALPFAGELNFQHKTSGPIGIYQVDGDFCVDPAVVQFSVLFPSGLHYPFETSGGTCDNDFQVWSAVEAPFDQDLPTIATLNEAFPAGDYVFEYLLADGTSGQQIYNHPVLDEGSFPNPVAAEIVPGAGAEDPLTLRWNTAGPNVTEYAIDATEECADEDIFDTTVADAVHPNVVDTVLEGTRAEGGVYAVDIVAVRPRDEAPKSIHRHYATQSKLFWVPPSITGEPQPDLKVNGADGPVSATAGKPVRLSLRMPANVHTGTVVDYFLLARKGMRVQSYDLASESWHRGTQASGPAVLGCLLHRVQAPAFSRRFARGEYDIVWGFDTLPDGVVQMQDAYVDTVHLSVR